MAKTIRSKFNVAEITNYGNGGGTKVVMFPVIGDIEENKDLVSGKIEMHISNPDAKFELGEYFVDFTKLSTPCQHDKFILTLNGKNYFCSECHADLPLKNSDIT